MRIDLTIRDRDGRRHDIAVRARDETTFGQVAAALAGEPEARWWSGARQLAAADLVGGPGLRSGDVLGGSPAGGEHAGADAALRLNVVGGPDAGRRRALTRGVTTLGRAGDCDIVLGDPSVSRRHARLTVSSAGVAVHDLGSTHGTWVDSLRVDEPGAELHPGSVLRIGETFLVVRIGAEPSAALRPGPDGACLVNRVPSAPAARPPAEIVLPERAAGSRPQRVQWLAALLPAVAGGVLALSMHSPQFLAFALLSPVVLLGTAAGDRLHWRRSARREAGSHRDRLRAARQQVAAALAAETRARRQAAPDPTSVAEIARGPGTGLWRHRRDGPELLHVRLGLADICSSTWVRADGERRPAGRLSAVPICVDLRGGPLGVAAPSPIGPALARWLLCQLAVLRSPADLELVLVLSEQTEPCWRWVRWLPHFRGRVARGPAERDALLSELAGLIGERASGRRPDQPWTGAWQVLLVHSDESLGDGSALHAVLGAGPAVGITAICVDRRLARLPPACMAVVATVGETGTQVHVRDSDGVGVTAVADQVSADWAEAVARALAPLVDGGADRGDALPDRCLLRDVLELRDLDAGAVIALWRRSGGRARTVLGIGDAGPVTVDLAEDGPHALVAGTTGAGKSELLQTLVAGLALHSPPDELAFVLIDYKGGAAFADCARLPHTVGMVTDLDAHLTRRALRSLDGELRRRERAFAEAGAADLDAYRASGRPEPVPRLVLVVDEFAALAAELPDFVGGLVGIAQRGRSLGVHLILATQRPGGVVSPEIRANTALRVALRMTDAGESCDVIGCEDAAHISRRTPGRAYLRAGATLTAVQTALLGAAAEPGAGDGVAVEPLDNWRRPVARPHPAASLGTDLHRLVEATRAAAGSTGHRAARRPWLPPLPSQLPAQSLDDASAPATITVGLCDRPDEQTQPPVEIDLCAAEPILIAGTGRSGRTTALTTIALRAAVQLPPDELHLYGIDAAGGSLAALTSLPHCGTVAPGTEPQVVARLLHRLDQQLVRRQVELVELGTTSAAAAWAGGHRLPLAVLLIDGWEALVAVAEDYDGGRSIGTVMQLLGSGPAAGITVVIAGGRGVLAPRPAGAIATRYLLSLADRGDYALAGLPARVVPDRMPPGRAIRAADATEVQFASCGAAEQPERYPRRIAERWGPAGGAGPIVVRPLPRRAALADLPRDAGTFVLGVGGDDAGPIVADLFAGTARLLVAGPARSGRSTLLRALLAQALADGIEVLLAAPARSALAGSGVAAIAPGERPDPAWPRSSRALVLVDDSEAFLDTPAGDALHALIRAAPDGLAVVAAGRTEELAISYRGLAGELRRARCALLLQPGPGDGELVGIRLPSTRAGQPPGRGILIGDPVWGPACAAGPVPIQAVTP